MEQFSSIGGEMKTLFIAIVLMFMLVRVGEGKENGLKMFDRQFQTVERLQLITKITLEAIIETQVELEQQIDELKAEVEELRKAVEELHPKDIYGKYLECCSQQEQCEDMGIRLKTCNNYCKCGCQD